MGLFVQNISLALSSNSYLLEKVSLPKLSKDKIDLTVAPGTVAIIGGVKYKGQAAPYKLTRGIVGIKNGAEAYLYSDRPFDGISLNFFGGQHVVSLSSMPAVKSKYSVVGIAAIEVSDYKDLVNYFNRSLTRDELVAEINKTVKPHLSNETISAVSRLISAETTDVSLRAMLNDVAGEIMKSRKTAALLMNMGLLLSARGITFHLNPLDDAEDASKKVHDALLDKAVDDYRNGDARDRQDRQAAAERQHEIDKIRAQNSNINENTETKNINTNTQGGDITIVEGKKEGSVKFCPECGTKIAAGAKFCPECGNKLK